MNNLQLVQNFRTVEFSFESVRALQNENPFYDIEVEALFTGPGGIEIRRPAFWDGGRTWRIRFAPTRPGVWHYVLSSKSSNGEVETGLNGLTGELRSVEYSGDYPI